MTGAYGEVEYGGAASEASSGGTVALGQASETGAAQTISVALEIGQVSETDAAQTISAASTVSLGQASEVDAAQTISVVLEVGQASESDAASIMGGADSQILNLMPIIETDTAVDLVTGIRLGLAVETTVAESVWISPMVLVGVVESSQVPGPVTIGQSVSLALTGSGVLEIESDLFVPPEITVAILDEEISRAPTTITVVAAEGLPTQEAVFAIDGTDVWTTDLDAAGGMTPTSLLLEATLGGQQGAHELTLTQQGPYGIVVSDTAAYEVLNDPWIAPFIAGTDAQAVEIPGAVSHDTRHWVLQDLLAVQEGGIGSYVLPFNPREMSSPHHELAFESKHTTALSGQYHVFQKGSSGMGPKEWTFKFYAPTQEMITKLEQYRDLNRRFYVIDHRNRAWKCMFSDLQVEPRLRHNFNGEMTDWGSDCTVTAIVLDQNWVTPA